jgi:hypothetical protein
VSDSAERSGAGCNKPHAAARIAAAKTKRQFDAEQDFMVNSFILIGAESAKTYKRGQAAGW